MPRTADVVFHSLGLRHEFGLYVLADEERIVYNKSSVEVMREEIDAYRVMKLNRAGMVVLRSRTESGKWLAFATGKGLGGWVSRWWRAGQQTYEPRERW